MKYLGRTMGALALTLLTAGVALADPATLVYLNGVPSPVYFNDGDSFRVLAGEYRDARARLAGFNTLESYGLAHQWGNFTARELLINAKQATMNARQGVWNCTSDGNLDTYGRMLWWCPDLAEDQIRKGLAHVMTITEEGGDPRLVEAQRLAKEEKLGMWAHGIPEYIVTSLHSINDDAGQSMTYNRLVSTEDGHSLKWLHRDSYKECELVCDDGGDAASRLTNAVGALRADPNTRARAYQAYSTEELELIASYVSRKKPIDKLMKHEADLGPFQEVLRRTVEQGLLGRDVKEPASCMIYVHFKRRFGVGRAACLR